jgi:hypothetical protein
MISQKLLASNDANMPARTGWFLSEKGEFPFVRPVLIIQTNLLNSLPHLSTLNA